MWGVDHPRFRRVDVAGHGFQGFFCNHSGVTELMAQSFGFHNEDHTEHKKESGLKDMLRDLCVLRGESNHLLQVIRERHVLASSSSVSMASPSKRFAAARKASNDSGWEANKPFRHV